jgi:TonB family protein
MGDARHLVASGGVVDEARLGGGTRFACDAAAAARFPAYGGLLLDAARALTSPAPRLALGLFDSDHLEERLMRLNRPISFLRGRSARAVTVIVTALLVAAGAFLALRPAVRAQEDPPVYRVGGDVSAPRLLHKVEPQYTEEARAARIEGKSVLSVVIGVDGKVSQATVQQGVGAGLDEQALVAVHQWAFEPARKDGQPVAVNATIEVNFRLL